MASVPTADRNAEVGRGHGDATAPGSGSVPSLWTGRLLRVHEETPTVRTFFFERPPRGFSFQPGQYVVARIPGLSDPRGDSRTFSISSAPSDLDAIAVTTRVGPSPFKQRLFASPPGAELELWGPFGSFTMDGRRPAVLVGGGIGITPFRSMIRQAAADRSTVPVVLLYSSRIPEELVYRLEFEELPHRWPAFRPTLAVSSHDVSTTEWKGVRGRIDAAMVRGQSDDLDNPLFYVCGPPTMVKDLHRLLVSDVRARPEDVRTELFQGY